MIQGYAETVDSGLYQDDEERMRFIKIVLSRSHYMNDLLRKLMEIAQLDMHPDRVRFVQTNLSKMLRKLAADYIPVLENHDMSFDFQIPDRSIEAMADMQLIERAVRNLIENAMQYGQSGGYLGLALRECGNVDANQGQVEIRVTDYGPGIPVEKQELIFERFYRGSDSRAGEGLGS